MDGKTQFIIVSALTLTAWLLWSFRGVSIIKYFKTDAGKGILKGILLAILFVVAGFFLSGCKGVYPHETSIYAGLDYTKNPSPFCESGGVDDRTTSNLGLKHKLYQSYDKLFDINAKYTHHSCAFNEDDANYDSAGIEFELRLR